MQEAERRRGGLPGRDGREPGRPGAARRSAPPRPARRSRRCGWRSRSGFPWRRAWGAAAPTPPRVLRAANALAGAPLDRGGPAGRGRHARQRRAEPGEPRARAGVRGGGGRGAVPAAGAGARARALRSAASRRPTSTPSSTGCGRRARRRPRGRTSIPARCATLAAGPAGALAEPRPRTTWSPPPCRCGPSCRASSTLCVVRVPWPPASPARAPPPSACSRSSPRPRPRRASCLARWWWARWTRGGAREAALEAHRRGGRGRSGRRCSWPPAGCPSSRTPRRSSATWPARSGAGPTCWWARSPSSRQARSWAWWRPGRRR